MFLRARKLVGIYSVIFWGGGAVLILTSGLTVANLAVQSDALAALIIAMELVAYLAITYFVVRLSLSVGGW
jgi:hypothetical protein